MIIITEEQAERFEDLKKKNEKEFGFPYLSPSSTNDFKDCAAKFTLRKEYRTVGLTSVAGSVIHELLDLTAKELNIRVKDTSNSYENERDALLDSAPDPKSFISVAYDMAVRKHTSTLVEDLILGETLAREKDYTFITTPGNLTKFFTGIKGVLMGTKERANSVFGAMLDKQAVATEVPGYFIHNGILVYGILDLVSITEKSIEIVDYKTIWSTTSRTNWDKLTTTFQGWCYNKFMLDFLESRGEADNNKPLTTTFRFMFINLPRDYNKINYDKLNVVVFNKSMTFDDKDDELYGRDIVTTCTLLKSGGGFIGNSKYGCNFCSYNNYCKYFNRSLT